MVGTEPSSNVASIATDPHALEVFYRSHVEAVQSFIARRVDEPFLAADLTADVFLAAIASAGSYRKGRGNPTAWLFGVARNVLAADRRRSARELRTTSQITGRALIDDDDIVRLEERIVAEDQKRRLFHAMKTLSSRERAVLELVALDGLTLTDVARTLGISPVAARVRLHRARHAMRDLLEKPNKQVAEPPALVEEVL